MAGGADVVVVVVVVVAVVAVVVVVGAVVVTGGWAALEAVGRVFNCKTVRDPWDRPVLLFRNDWNLNQLQEDHPDLALAAVAPVVSGTEPIAL